MQKRKLFGVVCFRGGCLDRGVTSKVKIFMPAILLFFVGCWSLNTYQSPSVLPPGKAAIGLGIGAGIEGYGTGLNMPYLEAAVYLRVGVIKNCEWGLKLSPFTGTYSDIKLQLLKKPILVSFDFGVSYCPYVSYMWWSNGGVWFGVYPILLVGTERFYGGIKYAYINNLKPRTDYYSRTTLALPGIMLGTAITMGSKVQLKPELNLYYDILNTSSNTFSQKILRTFGIGFQTTF